VHQPRRPDNTRTERTTPDWFQSAAGPGIVKRMRLIRGFGALAVLLLLLAGVPLALIALSGNPLPEEVSWETIRRALLRPDDGTLVVRLITLVGWIAWLVFAISALSELIELVSSHRISLRLPGLGGPQRMVAGLMLSVIAMAGSSPIVQADPVRVTPAVLPEDASGEAGKSTPRPGLDERDRGYVHLVEGGDDLWSLSEHYYGDGRHWRKIAMANPQLLTGGPDRLEPGWRLSIPDVKSPDAGSEARTIVVKRGDTLSSIAKEVYGSESLWPRILRANRAQLGDADDIVPGVRLVLPGKSQAKPATDDHREPAKGADDGAQEQKVPPPGETSTVSPSPRPVDRAPVDPIPVESPAEHASVALGLASAGSLLAAGVVAALAARRRVQLQTRPVGRRIASPPQRAVEAELLLGRRQAPLSLRTLDLATRAISAHCRAQHLALPPLRLAKVGDDQIELVLASSAVPAPLGFTVRGDSWLLEREHRRQLRAVPGVEDALRPYPSLVSIGRDDQDQQVLLDLESLGLLTLDGDPGLSTAVLAAMAIELAFSPSSDELVLTLIGQGTGLAEAVAKDNVTESDDLEGLLERWERRAATQRTHRSSAVVGEYRIDPDLADPWVPEVALINRAPSVEQSLRLIDLLTRPPRVTMAAVVAAPLAGTPWSLQLHVSGRDVPARATLHPLGLELAPQLITPPGQQAVVELITAGGSDETMPAPWWRDGRQPPDPPPDNVTYLGRRFGGWINAGTDGDEPMETRMVEARVGHSHPMLQLLGPIELVDAAGVIPPRAGKQCLEYCAWLLENPRTTAQAMASALAVAEGTRRSNMSRLRNWLGSDPSGEPYLPDAYSGRIALHPAVSSDWQRFQILTSPGVNRSSTAALRTALEMVKGAPLADAAPGQWHWAEELRTDMISAIRDLGVELTNRALHDNDCDLARWAASRALVAAPGDELLMVARIRTEHQAGNSAETERLTLQVAAHARNLGIDLDPETVMLLQEVMEGQVRARMA
jgi:LysM repeat protein